MQAAMITLIGTVATLVIIVLMALVIKEYREGSEFGGVLKILPVFFIVIVAVIILGQITTELTPYDFDEETGTLTISNSIEPDYTPWDEYGSDVRILLINDGVKSIGAGAFDTLTDLEYMRIPTSLSALSSSDFGVALSDQSGNSIMSPGAGEYIGLGDGVLYFADPSSYTYSIDGTTITGLSASGASIVYAALPSSHDGIVVTKIGNAAFQSSSLILALSSPTSSINDIGANSFRDSMSITTLSLKSSAKQVIVESYALNHCDALETLVLPDGTYSLARFSISYCGMLESFDFTAYPLEIIGEQAFRNCTALTDFYFPATLARIDANAFNGCTGVTSVEFQTGYSPATLNSNWTQWTFYDSDGTTEISKTDSTALAGSTFEGTSSALIKVEPGRRTLTEEQIDLVREISERKKLLGLQDDLTLTDLEAA